MKNLLEQSVKILIAVFIYAAVAMTMFSCSASNKTHWQKVHPHGASAGNDYLPGDITKVQYKHK